MKNKLSLFSFAILLSLLGCKEKDVLIAPYTPPSPSTAGGDRHVLVEELTGVKCTNCPDAARDLLNLQGTIGADKLIIVANHSAGSFSKPYTNSKYDFRSAEAQTIALFIGDYLGAPAAVFNRSTPASATYAFLSTTEWTSSINNELAKTNVINMTLSSVYDSTSRKLSIEAGVIPLYTLDGEHRISVVITEDNLIDHQLDKGVDIPNYVHRHVLRGTVTAALGNTITQPLKAGEKIVLKYDFTLPAAWVAKNCNIVAFVHHGGTPDKEVLQVEEKHVGE